MPIIVSAFISKINVNVNRNIEKYIGYGIKLLEIDTPKIIFIEKEVHDLYFINNKTNTKFIFFEKNEIYLYNEIDTITEYDVHTDNHSKDTIDYMFVQCHKTEWVKKAIKLNLYKDTQYIWVDFAIFHMLQMDSAVFKQTINKQYDNVRIASCWNPTQTYTNNIYKNIVWYFAGSVFGGHKDKLLIFADLMKKKCLEIILNKHHLMWEVNIWYLIYKENVDLFNYYLCNHDNSILINY